VTPNRSNTICSTAYFSPQTFNNAQNVCMALGGHLATYNDMYRLALAYGQGGWAAGDWIGNRANDDLAYCVNAIGNINNFEGHCDKNETHWYRCVNGSTYNE